MGRIIGLIIPEELPVTEPAETAPPEAPETAEDAEPAETAPPEREKKSAKK